MMQDIHSNNMPQSSVYIPQLPVEILTCIAIADHGKSYREMLAVPEFARYSLQNRELVMSMIIKTVELSDRFVKITLGKIHNEFGPAIIYKNDGEDWYYNNKLHRENGPAVHRITGFEKVSNLKE